MPSWLEQRTDSGGWRERFVPERFRGARFDTGWRGVGTLAAVGVAAMVIAIVVVLRERPVAQAVPPLAAVRTSTTVQVAGAPSGARLPGTAAASDSGPAGELVVSVVGMVHRGGLQRLPEGARVADAIAAAGGAQNGADLTSLNLAQRLQDGDQVLVGATDPSSGSPQLGSTTLSAGGRSSGAPPAKTGSTPSARIDLNTATEAELDALPGVGPVTATAIITWRNTNGRFTDIEQLGEVNGIGPARLARLRELVRI